VGCDRGKKRDGARRDQDDERRLHRRRRLIEREQVHWLEWQDRSIDGGPE
jgi:hypothetical protein